MVELSRLTVSLTKNGYLKVADVVKMHRSWEVLDNLEGAYPGINVKQSQAAKILGADPHTSQLPSFWDDIRQRGDDAVDAFTFCAVLLSHGKLIDVFRQSKRGPFCGYLERKQLSDKEYTNLVYAMATLGMCDYEKGSVAVSYDFYDVVYRLRDCGDLVQQLVASKLARCGWLNPDTFPHAGGRTLLSECKEQRLNGVFSMPWPLFKAWLESKIDMEPPENGEPVTRLISRRHPR